MLVVKPILASDPAIRPIHDQVLCTETVTLRISRTGFSLGYLPSSSAQWRVFPAVEDAADALKLSNNRSALFGAFENDMFIGAAVVMTHESGWADVLDIRVDATHRRVGTGKALLASCQTWSARSGMVGLHIAVSDQHAVMCQFLEHCSFSVQGMDRMAIAMTSEERQRPLMQRACLLHFYRMAEKS